MSATFFFVRFSFFLYGKNSFFSIHDLWRHLLFQIWLAVLNVRDCFWKSFSGRQVRNIARISFNDVLSNENWSYGLDRNIAFYSAFVAGSTFPFWIDLKWSTFQRATMHQLLRKVVALKCRSALSTISKPYYDIVIVGGGMVGNAMAISLSNFLTFPFDFLMSLSKLTSLSIP